MAAGNGVDQLLHTVAAGSYLLDVRLREVALVDKSISRVDNLRCG